MKLVFGMFIWFVVPSHLSEESIVQFVTVTAFEFLFLITYVAELLIIQEFAISSLPSIKINPLSEEGCVFEIKLHES